MAIITLTSDFGLKDPFVGALKGRILSQVPDTRIIDISHDVSPFDVHECAYIVKQAFQEFPKGSIHIIGIASEQTPESEHLLAVIDGHYFIAADNGVLSILSKEHKLLRLNEITLPNSGPTSFPELDVFPSVACHLARGGKEEVVSKPISKIKEVKLVEPRISNEGRTITGNVIYIDHLGNVVTNISKSLFEAYRNGRSFELTVRRQRLNTIFNTYSEMVDFELPHNQRKGPSDFLAIFNHSGLLELAIYKSNMKTVGGASTLIGLGRHDVITINFR